MYSFHPQKAFLLYFHHPPTKQQREKKRNPEKKKPKPNQNEKRRAFPFPRAFDKRELPTLSERLRLCSDAIGGWVWRAELRWQPIKWWCDVTWRGIGRKTLGFWIRFWGVWCSFRCGKDWDWLWISVVFGFWDIIDVALNIQFSMDCYAVLENRYENFQMDYFCFSDNCIIGYYFWWNLFRIEFLRKSNLFRGLIFFCWFNKENFLFL